MKIRWLVLSSVIALIAGGCASAPVATPSSPTPAPVAAEPGEEAAPRDVTFQTEDGVTLAGRLFGQGRTGVALSHMFPTDQASWHAFAQTLAGNGYLALAYDFRGYGKSGGEKRVAEIDRDVRAAVAFLRAQGAQRVILIGASMGGTASAKVAASVGAAALVVLSSPRSFQGLDVSDEDVRLFRGASLWIGSRGDGATIDVEAMHAFANSPKSLHVYAGSAHGTFIFDTADGVDLAQRMIDFLVSYAPPDR